MKRKIEHHKKAREQELDHKEENTVDKSNECSANEDIIWLRRMISHNVRMPMSVISGYGELLRQGLLSPEETNVSVQNICDNITYLSQILQVVFDEVSDTHNLQIIDIISLVRRIQGYVTEMAKKSKISILVISDQPHLWIKAQPIPIMRMFYHILENSFKYLRTGDSIWINLYPVEDDQVLIVYRDNGPGLGTKEIARIFEQNYRGSNSVGTSGTGYGMHDVKKIVETYDGHIEASSQIGNGLVIFILFPMCNQEIT